MRELTITLPLPPMELWQNYRGHWARSHRVKASHRDGAMLRARAAIGRANPPKWTAATADFAFYWPNKRRRDPLNAVAAMKAAVDGLVDAGVLADDDKLMPGATTFEVDKKNPRVVVVIRPVAGRSA